jgi:hypothetical protein
MVYTRIKKDYLPHGRPMPCTLCTRMYCIWKLDGPEITCDFVEWMYLVDANDENFIDIEEERKRQTVAERKRRIYTRFNERIYGVEDNYTILPPACVQWGVNNMPDNLYWMLPHPPITYPPDHTPITYPPL